MCGPLAKSYECELPIIYELDVPETLCSNSSVVADDFIRILRNTVVELWEEKQYSSVCFFLARKMDNNILAVPKLIAVDMHLFEEYPLDIIRDMSILMDAIAVALVSETHVLFEKGEIILDQKAQKSLILSIDHCYASPHKQCWLAPVKNKKVGHFYFCSDLGISLLPEYPSAIFEA